MFLPLSACWFVCKIMQDGKEKSHLNLVQVQTLIQSLYIGSGIFSSQFLRK